MARVGRTIRGFGDYSIKHNTIMSGGMSPPMITNSVVTGGVILRHREYLRDISAATNFTNLQFDVNPGINATFPWLSQIATSFEQYKFRGLVFEFKSMAADVVLSNAASTALGTVIMGTKYNVLELPFTNKFEMENWEFTSSCKPSCNLMHPIECAASQTPVDMLYIRTSNATQGAMAGDLRLYDLCNFNIAVQGMQNTGQDGTSIGELWATYEVELYKPKLEEDINTSFAHYDEQALNENGITKLGEPQNGYPLGNTNGAPALSKFYPSVSSNSTLPTYIIPSGRPFDSPPGTTGGTLYINDSIGKRLLITLTYFWPSGITNITSFIGTFAPNPHSTSSPDGFGYKVIPTWNANSLYQIDAAQMPAGTPTTVYSRYLYELMIECESDNVIIPFGFATWSGNGVSQFDFWITEVGPNAN